MKKDHGTNVEVTSQYVEFSRENREKVMTDYIRALSAMHQSGIINMFIGESQSGNQLYYVFADVDLTFVEFVTVTVNDDGSITTSTFIAKNAEFIPFINISSPIVIDGCSSFEEFLEATGFRIVTK